MPSESQRFFPSGDKLIDACIVLLAVSAVAAVVLLFAGDSIAPSPPDTAPPEPIGDVRAVAGDDTAGAVGPPQPRNPQRGRLQAGIESAPIAGELAVDPGEYPGPMRMNKPLRLHAIAGVARIGTAYTVYGKNDTRVSPTLDANR